ncbi:hypothetical protein MPTK1_2g05280 [Marchantia polymorpha subsp. ruderalis]|uniref:Uncharacterized protein n=1 Tax=Marchantia polymorpha TaxID=3197 RepID=A0A2R6X7Z0_MARPO|nr:hypothetical protein MARPO_0031s0182 [Marchantia polymorpha]BBN01169.1 hypothetical protein Mp_2g05280 [Marchantia polymorpha subsp. ruderalis]|eukprot:PTQ42220.1 hypothetical protein MARPO_0031s0182 [Marchantia polymorpha]
MELDSWANTPRQCRKRRSESHDIKVETLSRWCESGFHTQDVKCSFLTTFIHIKGVGDPHITLQDDSTYIDSSYKYVNQGRSSRSIDQIMYHFD